MNRRHYFNISIALFFFFVGTTTFAENQIDVCHQRVHDQPIRSIVASASFWSNWRKSKGSISFESNAIFEKAKEQATTLSAPIDFCPKGCSIAPGVVMVFRSAPQKVLFDYRDSGHCQELFKSTTEKPLHYANANIKTIDELNEWIGDLSQGDGENGEDLYEKCDASCSPRYEYVIAGNAGGASFAVHATVICGAARDKDDNQYDLESFFRWTCKKL